MDVEHFELRCLTPFDEPAIKLVILFTKIAFWYFLYYWIGGHGKFNWGTPKDEDDYLLDQDDEEQEIRKYEEVKFSIV